MKQIQIAEKYIGQKESAGNVFPDSSPLGKALHKAGQKNGEAWCAYFVEAVFVEAFPEKEPALTRLFSASAVKTYENFKAAGYTVSDKPKPGDIVIWQRYKDGVKLWQGHAGIVTDVINANRFKTIEGNTNSAGSREGDSVQRKERTLTRLANGLNVLGFITL